MTDPNRAPHHDSDQPGRGATMPAIKTEQKPWPHPLSICIGAIETACALIEQMEPLTTEEGNARLRVSARLLRLQNLLEADRDQGKRLSAAEVALLACLETHPDRQQAIHDHLVMPLLAISGSNTRSLRAWVRRWISDAADAVYRELDALSANKGRETT